MKFGFAVGINHRCAYLEVGDEYETDWYHCFRFEYPQFIQDFIAKIPIGESEPIPPSEDDFVPAAFLCVGADGETIEFPMPKPLGTADDTD